MGLIEILSGRTTCLDANVFIYAIEGHDRFAEPLGRLFDGVARRSLRAVTSEITLAETLVRPFREERMDLVKRYRSVVQTRAGLTVAPVSRAALIEAARLRALFPPLKLPDAVHAATARLHGCAVLLTNDTRLGDVPGIEVIQLSEVV